MADTGIFASVVSYFGRIATSLETMAGNTLNTFLRTDTASQGLSSTEKTNAKTNIDLQNVDNTADADKPVSTAQAAADAATLSSAEAYALSLLSGAGLTYSSEEYSASGVNATVYVAGLTPNVGSTNADYAVVPKGTGALLTAVPDGTTTGGNKRGDRAIDLSMSRSSAAHVASGADSVLVGSDGTASGTYSVSVGGGASTTSYALAIGLNTASGAYSIAMGYALTSSGTNSIAIGKTITSNSAYSIAIGSSINAAATSSVAIGDNTSVSQSGSIGIGTGVSATGSSCVVIGPGNSAGANYSTVFGDSCNSPSQCTFTWGMPAYNQVSTTHPNRTFRCLLSGSSTSATTVNLQCYNQSYGMSASGIVDVVGRVIGAKGSDQASFGIEALVDFSTTPPTIVGKTVTPKYNTAGAAAWSVDLVIDAGNRLTVACTGAAATTINWVAKFDCLSQDKAP